MQTRTPAPDEAPASITGVRLPPEVRQALQKEALRNHRSLSQEIIQRLRSTLNADAAPPAHVPGAPKIHDYATADSSISDAERLLITYFSRLPPEKQLALLTFLNPAK